MTATKYLHQTPEIDTREQLRESLESKQKEPMATAAIAGEQALRRPPTSSLLKNGEGRSCEGTKQVSFNKAVAVRAALHINDYTKEEHHATWYTTDEHERSQRQIKALVRKLNQGFHLPCNDTLSTRGLECRTKSGIMKRFGVRSKAKMAVCYEQERQWQSKTCDPDMLAMLYYEKSKQSQADASIQGLQDELSALT